MSDQTLPLRSQRKGQKGFFSDFAAKKDFLGKAEESQDSPGRRNMREPGPLTMGQGKEGRGSRVILIFCSGQVLR